MYLENHAPYGQLITGSQFAVTRYWRAVDERSITAVCVPNMNATTLHVYRAMAPAYCVTVDSNEAVLGPTDQAFWQRELELLAGKRAIHHLEYYYHAR
jgi:hypothetical protein